MGSAADRFEWQTARCRPAPGSVAPKAHAEVALPGLGVEDAPVADAAGPGWQRERVGRHA